MFWFFLAVFWACETYLYSQGHDTWLFTHKTPAEKELRKQKVNCRQDQEATKRG